MRLLAAGARGHRHRPRAWPGRARRHRAARGRHPQARRGGRLPPAPARGGGAHGHRHRADACATEERYRINLGGTRAVFEHCRHYGVEQVLFVGRHTYYGAGAGLAALPHRRRAAAGAGAASRSWPIWSPPTSTPPPRSGACPSCTPRCCASATRSGPPGTGTLASFLRGRRVPMVLGFDPLFQFMHEDDAADAIVLGAGEAAARHLQRGGAAADAARRDRARGRTDARCPCPSRCSRCSSAAAGCRGSPGRRFRTSSTRWWWTRRSSARRRGFTTASTSWSRSRPSPTSSRPGADSSPVPTLG